MRTPSWASTPWLTRERLAEAGVPEPRYRVATAAGEAARLARELGYPLVVKPGDGWGSVNTRLVRDEAELREHFRVLASASYSFGIRPSGEVLLEELVEGPLVSIETLTRGGMHEVLGITDRILGGRPFFVELGGSFPAEVPGGDEAVGAALRALDAIGFDYGPAHTEVVLSKDGPKIIERRARSSIRPSKVPSARRATPPRSGRGPGR